MAPRQGGVGGANGRGNHAVYLALYAGLCAGDGRLRNPTNDLCLSQACVGGHWPCLVGRVEGGVASDAGGVVAVYSGDFPEGVDHIVWVRLLERVHCGDGCGEGGHGGSFELSSPSRIADCSQFGNISVRNC